MVKGKDLRLQGGTGPKIGGYQAEGATKRELIVKANMIAECNLYIFRSDGVFGDHSQRDFTFP